jgi:hypothetical protein
MGRFVSSQRWSVALALCIGAAAQAQGTSNTVVYRCPGPPVLYTDAISQAEARERGCRTIEGAAITVIQGPRPRTPASAPPPAARGSDARVDVAQQRARDSDARRILEEELKKEEDRLATMQKDLSGGEPERKGDERNYQKYLDRVAEMKAAVARKESDIAAIKRELSKIAQ